MPPARAAAWASLRATAGPEVRVGDVVSARAAHARGAREAVVRFVGKTRFKDGDWVGLELSEQEGRNDGSVDGVRYFQCRPGHGLFVQLEKVCKISPGRPLPLPLAAPTTAELTIEASDGSRASSDSDGPDDAAAASSGIATPTPKPMRWLSVPSLFDDIVIEGTVEGQRYKKLSEMLGCPLSGRVNWESFIAIMRALMGDLITEDDLQQEWADAGEGGMTIGRLYTLLVSSDHYHVSDDLDRLLEEDRTPRAADDEERDDAEDERSNPAGAVQAAAGERTLPALVEQVGVGVPPSRRLDVYELLLKVLGNIADKPADPKYRTLKKDNKNIADTLLNHPAAVSILLAAGFVDQDGTLHCPDTAELGTIGEVVAVLERFVASFEGEKQSAPSSALAAAGALGEGRRQAAEAQAEDSQALDEGLEIAMREGTHLIELGNEYQSLAQFDEAIKHHSDALSIFRDIGNRQGEGAALGNLGNAYEKLGRYDEAIKHHSAALSISREIGDRLGEGHDLGSLGIAYNSLGRYDEAIKHHSDALSISREIGDRQGEGNALVNLGTAYEKLGRYDEAIKRHSDALSISREIGDRLGEGHDLVNLGKAYDSLGRYDEAIKHHSAALAVFDAVWDALGTDEQRVSYGDGSMQICARALQVVLVRVGQIAEALLCAERARSRAFELLLAQHRLGHDGDTQGEPSAPSQQREGVLDLTALRSVAARQRAALVFFSQVDATTVFAWVLTSSPAAALVFERLAVPEGQASLAKSVDMARRALRAPARSSGEDAGRSRNHEQPSPPGTLGEQGLLPEMQPPPTDKLSNEDLCRLHGLLIEPLDHAIKSERRLVIIPDGVLFALPFAALLGPDNRHLIEKYTLQVAPSAGTLLELDKRATARKPASTVAEPPCALVVGDPDFNGELPQLHHARMEAQEVCRQLSSTRFGDGVTLLIGEKATKQAVCYAMRSSELIHVATHGASDGVFLSGSTIAEGKLTMDEVHKLDLAKAELVVLSECNSFKGELHADGVIGITRAFAAAGAPTLLSTLWEVSDSATSELMQRFYSRWLKDVAGDAAAALQGAMVSMIHNKWAQYTTDQWAPFVVYGIAASADQNTGATAVPASALDDFADELAALLRHCRINPMFNRALAWCKEEGISSIDDFIEVERAKQFADALLPELKQIKRKILLDACAAMQRGQAGGSTRGREASLMPA